MTGQPNNLPLYYPHKTQADMLDLLQRKYLRSSGWLESADKKLSVRDGSPIPWFTYAAIDFIERNLTSDLSVFEYGGGHSTLYWAERLKRVQSIDHDANFGDYIKPLLPENADLRIVQENDTLPPLSGQILQSLPKLQDPPKDTKTFRGGQLNHAFQAYALEILKHPKNSFDIVVVDGMARILSTWAAIQGFQRDGFIIFDNSDRDFYQPAFDMLDESGYRRIDFSGLGPINPYEWCTSVFYQTRTLHSTRWFTKTSTNPALEREKTGILVLGYNRPLHLQAVLESIRLQGRIADVHVYIDGTQNRAEHKNANSETIEIAQGYSVRKVHAQKGHLGIEKLMLNALDALTVLYDRLIVLEDDCFPLESSLSQFDAALDTVAERQDIYSVYGHHFGTEPEDTYEFTRFQGWGWAAHSERIRDILPELKALFLMDEDKYQDAVAEYLTDQVIAKLDVTAKRRVVNVLRKCFSWDSATAMLTAARGMKHLRTETAVVKNTGITEGIGHFQKDSSHLRAPPFNMITLDEAWASYDQSTHACSMEKSSYGLDKLDLKIRRVLPRGLVGFFVEIGGYDGVKQNNSVLLEKAGWTGMLIEAVPGNYAKCVKSRPNVIVEHAACVPFGFAAPQTTVTDAGLMSTTTETVFATDRKEEWTKRGAGFAGRDPQEIVVPALPISTLFEKHDITKIDLLILDVEGSEISVLDGLDFDRHAPSFIVAEDAFDDSIHDYLSGKGYIRREILLERKFTRDCFYVRGAAQAGSELPSILGTFIKRLRRRPA